MKNMTYEETVLFIKNFLSSPESLQVFANNVENLKNIICMIEEHADKMTKDEQIRIVANAEQITEVRESMTIIKSILLNNPITENIKDFVFTYTLLVSNWINNCCEKKLDSVLLDIDFINRFVQYHLSSIELIKILPEITQKLNSMNKIGLPSIQLAKHYLGVLDNAV